MDVPMDFPTLTSIAVLALCLIVLWFDQRGADG
jgi:hypothetical protein